MELTIDEIKKIEMEMISLEDMELQAPVWHSKPLLRKSTKVLPLEHEAASESFLVAEMEGRARLSCETRLREERRLALKGRKRKAHTGGGRGRRHWKRKLQTKEKALERAYERDAYQWFRGACYAPVDITREEWDRWLAPIFENYPRKSLKWKKPANVTMNVYTMDLTYHPVDARNKPKKPQLVYKGADSAMWDVQQPRYAERVVELTTGKSMV